jgi:solute carrier family 25, member 39/40
LDVVKVRLQGQGGTNIHTASETFFKILRTEGWLSLYRGFIPTMAMSLPGTVVYFVGYERVKDVLTENQVIKSEAVPLISGAVARVFAATVVSPLELIRTRMQFKGIESGKLKPVTSELVLSIRKEGTRVLWRGLQPTLWRDVPFSAIYWSILEPSKSKIIKILSEYQKHEPSWLQTTLVSFACGAVSGSFAAALTTPFDVAKTRQQLILNHVTPEKSRIETKGCPSTTWVQLKEIWREDKWRGLTRGMGPRVAKVAPACAIMIGSYEFGKSILK